MGRTCRFGAFSVMLSTLVAACGSRPKPRVAREPTETMSETGQDLAGLVASAEAGRVRRDLAALLAPFANGPELMVIGAAVAPPIVGRPSFEALAKQTLASDTQRARATESSHAWRGHGFSAWAGDVSEAGAAGKSPTHFRLSAFARGEAPGDGSIVLWRLGAALGLEAVGRFGAALADGVSAEAGLEPALAKTKETFAEGARIVLAALRTHDPAELDRAVAKGWIHAPAGPDAIVRGGDATARWGTRPEATVDLVALIGQQDGTRATWVMLDVIERPTAASARAVRVAAALVRIDGELRIVLLHEAVPVSPADAASGFVE